MGAEDGSDDTDRDREGATTTDEPSGRSDDPFSFEDYYDLLGVGSDASSETIERAYREMAKHHHPDVSDHPEPEAERRFRQLLQARDVLTSVETRRAYDELGHEEYCRQSESLGEPVRRTDDGSSGPEPRPEPAAGGDSNPGRVQRSARGAARRRGDPLVTSADEAFADDGAVSSEDEDTSGGRGADRDVYTLLSDDGPPGSRSLRYVAGRWAAAWRNRLLVGLGSVTLVFVVSVLGPSLLSAAGVAVSGPSPGVRSLYLVALGAVITHLAYSGTSVERQLPPGRFLADRELGRFSTTTSRRWQRRGAASVSGVFMLATVSATRGVPPWTHAADALRGSLADPFPWFDARGGGLADWTTPLDALVTGSFVLAAVLGTAGLALGVSASLWRARYERGLAVHPGLWEWPFALALVSLPAALAAGPVELFALPGLSVLPDTVATAAGIDGTRVTLATAAVTGMGLSLAVLLLVRVRLALGSGDTDESEDDARPN